MSMKTTDLQSPTTTKNVLTRPAAKGSVAGLNSQYTAQEPSKHHNHRLSEQVPEKSSRNSLFGRASHRPVSQFPASLDAPSQALEQQPPPRIQRLRPLERSSNANLRQSIAVQPFQPVPESRFKPEPDAQWGRSGIAQLDEHSTLEPVQTQPVQSTSKPAPVEIFSGDEPRASGRSLDYALSPLMSPSYHPIAIPHSQKNVPVQSIGLLSTSLPTHFHSRGIRPQPSRILEQDEQDEPTDVFELDSLEMRRPSPTFEETLFELEGDFEVGLVFPGQQFGKINENPSPNEELFELDGGVREAYQPEPRRQQTVFDRQPRFLHDDDSPIQMHSQDLQELAAEDVAPVPYSPPYSPQSFWRSHFGKQSPAERSPRQSVSQVPAVQPRPSISPSTVGSSTTSNASSATSPQSSDNGSRKPSPQSQRQEYFQQGPFSPPAVEPARPLRQQRFSVANLHRYEALPTFLKSTPEKPPVSQRMSIAQRYSVMNEPKQQPPVQATERYYKQASAPVSAIGQTQPRAAAPPPLRQIPTLPNVALRQSRASMGAPMQMTRAQQQHLQELHIPPRLTSRPQNEGFHQHPTPLVPASKMQNQQSGNRFSVQGYGAAGPKFTDVAVLPTTDASRRVSDTSAPLQQPASEGAKAAPQAPTAKRGLLRKKQPGVAAC